MTWRHCDQVVHWHLSPRAAAVIDRYIQCCSSVTVWTVTPLSDTSFQSSSFGGFRRPASFWNELFPNRLLQMAVEHNLAWVEMGVAVKMVLFSSFTDTVEAQTWVLDSQHNGWVLRPTQHKTAYVGDVLPSQSLGSLLILNVTQQKQTTQEPIV